MAQRNPSKITTELAVDDPLIQNAGFEFGRDDRQYLDNQVRGIQQHLVAALIRGRHATYVRVAASSATLVAGDNVCLALEQVEPQVTKCTAGALTDAVAAFGVVVLSAAPGAYALVAFGGTLPPVITGLAAGAAGFVRTNPSTGRCERVAALGSGDYGIGFVSSSGHMLVIPGIGAGSTLAFTLPEGDAGDALGIDGVGGFQNLGPLPETVGNAGDLQASDGAGGHVAVPVVDANHGGTGFDEADLTGQALKAITVNATEDGYEFTDIPAGAAVPTGTGFR